MTRPLRVVQVVDSLAAGGSERMAVRIANALTDHVDLSVLCTTRAGGPLEDEIDPRVGRLRISRRTTLDPVALAGFRRFVRTEEISVVHAHSTSVYFVRAALAALRGGPVIIWHDHNSRTEERSPLLTRLAGNSADQVLAVSDDIAAWQEAAGIEHAKIEVFPNFVDSDPPGAPPAADVPGEPGRRVVAVANLRPEKNHLGLLDSFRAVVDEVPGAHLVLVGATPDGAHREEVEQRTRALGLVDDVSIMGVRDDVPSVLAACDVGVLASTREGFPLALIEYGLAGLPVVATRVGQVAEATDGGRCARLVEPGDVAGMASALVGLLISERERTSLGAQFQEHVAQRYTARVVVPRLVQVYRDALPRPVERNVTALAHRILVVSSVVHYRASGRVFGYTPYVRELDAWSHLFGEVRIIGPLLEGEPPADTSPFASTNVTLAALPTTGGDDLVAKLRQVALVPYLLARLAAEMRRADAIHVRAPSNLGVLALPLAPLFSPRLHCKYAGMWGPFDGEPRSSRFQRWVLGSRWWRGPVSVYGRTETDPPHVLDSFSTALTAAQLARRRPRRVSAAKTPLRLLFVGRLVPTKNVDVVVEAVAGACAMGADVTLDVIGEGPALAGLVELSARMGVSDRVRFRGALPVDEVLEAYRGADVLALVSDSEGWPKVIVEAMAFGVVPIGNDRGSFPRSSRVAAASRSLPVTSRR